MRKTMLVVFATSVLTLGLSPVAHAQRYVVVNGVAMSPASLAALDQAACQMVPNGSYWLNTSTGVWGYTGNPIPQGRISDGCYQARRPSLSERRMLFSPHDWVR